MRCSRKIGEEILAGKNGKREIKTENDFWAAKN
jgi:hypothetical protein